MVQHVNCQLIFYSNTWRFHEHSEEFMWIYGCSLLMGAHACSGAHGCPWVFMRVFHFFGCHPFSLLSGFPCSKRKIKVSFREVRARFLGIKWHTCWFGWWFCLMRCYLAAKPVPWWPDGNPWVLGQLGLDGYLFLKINLGLENPKSLAHPGFEGFFEINLNVGQ